MNRTGGSLYVLAPGINIGQDGDDEVTILDVRRGRYWRGNATAKQVIALLQRPTTAEAIAGELQAKYHVDLERILCDVSQILVDLRAAKLVRKARS